MSMHRAESDYLHSFPEEQAPSAADIPQPGGIDELVQQIKDTADKLLRDKANRGDVKLLSTALRELRYAFKVFAPVRGRRKVTVFGSARTPPDDPAYKQAVEFGRLVAQEGFMVITGAASGIMEAGHVGAGRENSIGVNILLPFEQSANSVIAGDTKLMHLKYFFTRKLLFVKESDAVALFPGGFGTQDEAFEALTLVQTGKSHMFPIVCVDYAADGYWQAWDRYIRTQMLQRRMISPADTSLYKVTTSVEEAVAEIRDFYRVYHSMRYVRGDLVLRLQRAPSAQLLERVRSEFKDILAGGTFDLTHADPVEANEAHIQNLPRLRFRFDRRSLGRLRQLIDLLNREIE
jgi:hypothetical protein